MLFIDEVYIAQGSWFMALRIMNLDQHLKTGSKIENQIGGLEIDYFDEMTSYEHLDQYIFLVRVFRFDAAFLGCQGLLCRKSSKSYTYFEAVGCRNRMVFYFGKLLKQNVSKTTVKFQKL